MGRPTKLTAETSQTILDVIAAGGTVAVAAPPTTCAQSPAPPA